MTDMRPFRCCNRIYREKGERGTINAAETKMIITPNVATTNKNFTPFMQLLLPSTDYSIELIKTLLQVPVCIHSNFTFLLCNLGRLILNFVSPFYYSLSSLFVQKFKTFKELVCFMFRKTGMYNFFAIQLF